ncbi:MAG: hypothetical protein ABIF10_07870 [Candidatus Woesearchaeota archaeon]
MKVYELEKFIKHKTAEIAGKKIIEKSIFLCKKAGKYKSMSKEWATAKNIYRNGLVELVLETFAMGDQQVAISSDSIEKGCHVVFLAKEKQHPSPEYPSIVTGDKKYEVQKYHVGGWIDTLDAVVSFMTRRLEQSERGRSEDRFNITNIKTNLDFYNEMSKRTDSIIDSRLIQKCMVVGQAYAHSVVEDCFVGDIPGQDAQRINIRFASGGLTVKVPFKEVVFSAEISEEKQIPKGHSGLLMVGTQFYAVADSKPYIIRCHLPGAWESCVEKAYQKAKTDVAPDIVSKFQQNFSPLEQKSVF